MRGIKSNSRNNVEKIYRVNCKNHKPSQTYN